MDKIKTSPFRRMKSQKDESPKMLSQSPSSKLKTAASKYMKNANKLVS